MSNKEAFTYTIPEIEAKFGMSIEYFRDELGKNFDLIAFISTSQARHEVISAVTYDKSKGTIALWAKTPVFETFVSSDLKVSDFLKDLQILYQDDGCPHTKAVLAIIKARKT